MGWKQKDQHFFARLANMRDYISLYSSYTAVLLFVMQRLPKITDYHSKANWIVSPASKFLFVLLSFTRFQFCCRFQKEIRVFVSDFWLFIKLLLQCSYVWFHFRHLPCWSSFCWFYGWSTLLVFPAFCFLDGFFLWTLTTRRTHFVNCNSFHQEIVFFLKTHEIWLVISVGKLPRFVKILRNIFTCRQIYAFPK